MKHLNKLFWVLCLLLITSCSSDKHVENDVVTISLAIHPERGFYPVEGDIHEVKEGMMIRRVLTNEMECVNYDYISGFNFEDGYFYVLDVEAKADKIYASQWEKNAYTLQHVLLKSSAWNVTTDWISDAKIETLELEDKVKSALHLSKNSFFLINEFPYSNSCWSVHVTEDIESSILNGDLVKTLDSSVLKKYQELLPTGKDMSGEIWEIKTDDAVLRYDVVVFNGDSVRDTEMWLIDDRTEEAKSIFGEENVGQVLVREKLTYKKRDVTDWR